MCLNAFDDPIVSHKTIEYDAFEQNPNVVLATTKTGGHISCHESIFGGETWYATVALNFFDSFLEEKAEV
jgi:uncharacterized protein